MDYLPGSLTNRSLLVSRRLPSALPPLKLTSVITLIQPNSLRCLMSLIWRNLDFPPPTPPPYPGRDTRFSRNSFWATCSRKNQLLGIVPDRYCDVNNNTWGNVYRWGQLFTHHLETKHSVGSCRNVTFLKSQVHHTSCTNLTFLSFKVASSG